MTIFKTLFVVCCSVLLIGETSNNISFAARRSESVALGQEQTASLNQLIAYVQKLGAIKGNFTQINPRGNRTAGSFILSRPGRMRFDYTPPNPYVVISDGTWVTLANRTTMRGDQYPLSQTPLRFLLSKNVDIKNETIILAVDVNNGLVSVTFEDRKGLLGGKLVLVYDKQANILRQWTVIDGQGRRTTVILENISAISEGELDPKLFAIKVNKRNEDRMNR